MFGFAAMAILVIIIQYEGDLEANRAEVPDWMKWNGNTFGKMNNNNSDLPWDPK